MKSRIEELAREEYEKALRSLCSSGGVRPNWQQADPFNVPVAGAPAGYTMRDFMIGQTGSTFLR
jgi:hypothetical protein